LRIKFSIAAESKLISSFFLTPAGLYNVADISYWSQFPMIFLPRCFKRQLKIGLIWFR